MQKANFVWELNHTAFDIIKRYEERFLFAYKRRLNLYMIIWLVAFDYFHLALLFHTAKHKRTLEPTDFDCRDETKTLFSFMFNRKSYRFEMSFLLFSTSRQYLYMIIFIHDYIVSWTYHCIFVFQKQTCNKPGENHWFRGQCTDDDLQYVWFNA